MPSVYQGALKRDKKAEKALAEKEEELRRVPELVAEVAKVDGDSGSESEWGGDDEDCKENIFPGTCGIGSLTPKALH